MSPKSTNPIVIYGDKRSGNCYKVQLVCGFLGIVYDWQNVDIMAGETKTDAFKAKTANAKIPIIELPDGQVLTESNAICNYLAHGTALYPSDAMTQARIQEWQFFEQYSHEPFIAVARFINLYLGLPDDRKEEYVAKQAGGYKALDVMEQTLSKQTFLAGEALTTADIALYAYTHVAQDGGFDLSRYPAINSWFNRIEGSPGFCKMEC